MTGLEQIQMTGTRSDDSQLQQDQIQGPGYSEQDTGPDDRTERDRCDQDRRQEQVQILLYTATDVNVRIQMHLATATADSNRQQHQVKPQTSDRNTTTVS